MSLRKWEHACNAVSSGDVLQDPSCVSFSQDVEEARSPFSDILEKLFIQPDLVNSEDVPSKAWLESEKKDIFTAPVPHTGSLTMMKRAEIANWLQLKINQRKKHSKDWVGLLLNAHAQTLYIASNLKADPKFQNITERTLIQRAWIVQFSGTAPHWDHVDVDAQCLDHLEEEMFEQYECASRAGNYQWGLDAGDHQDR
ncbi:hypothetical protein C0992_011018 [Termitomyces sp. T32_za158]|nr:hypothetical protein C0992_011018 [Termitomyces sp. T32_za158]